MAQAPFEPGGGNPGDVESDTSEGTGSVPAGTQGDANHRLNESTLPLSVLAVDTPPGQEPPPVVQLPSRFELVSTLGAGGFGVVHLARDLETASIVALKTIRTGHAELKYRLKREFRLLAGLKHPNLVSFYELFAEREPIFFTMEYVQGTTFLKHVRPGGGLHEQRLRRALPQLFDGLVALHDAGKLHRDLKPSNVLITPEERVVILDLGLATELKKSSVGTSIEFAGTLHYMAPERFGGEPLSVASDWYAVGVMLYEALTGKAPVEGTLNDFLVAFRERRAITPPAQLAPGAPPDLARLAMSLLAQEPRARPAAAEIAVALGHLCSPAPGPERLETAPLLVGREPELKRLDEALAEVRSGKPATVLLDGNPGVGKTTLVERFVERVEADGETIILRGRCYERERVPYQGIDSLIDDLCRLLSTTERSTTRAMLPRNVTALVRLFPLLERVPVISEWSDDDRFTRVEQQELRRLAFGALRDMLARVGERRTLVLHIDDLQWGDLDTAALLREVLRPPDAPVMLLILGFRREDRATSACLRALVNDDLGSPIELHLNPLRKTDADELLHKLLRVELPQDQVAQLTSQAEGNPLFIQMMARFATDPDVHRNPDVPLDLGGALGACIKALPSRARALLDTLSVAGHPLSERVARRAAGFSGPLWEEWDLLNGQHLVRSSGIHEERTLETFHDRIRQAVLGVLPLQRAQECHRALAEALERTGSADPDSLAGHHEAAGNIERALHFTVEAATQADQALAFDRAARLFQRALALASIDDARRPALMVARAHALANAGRCEQAARAFREAAEQAKPEERTALLRRAAEQLLFGGQIDEARELIRSDLRAVGFPLARDSRSAMLAVLLHRLQLRFRRLGVRDDVQTRASAEELALLEHIYRVCIGLSGVDLFIGGEMAARYMLRALEMGDARSIARGLCLITGHAAIEAPSSRRTRSLLQTMITQGERVGDHLVDTSVRTVQGLQAYFEGHWREALAHFDEVEKRIHEEHQGLVWEMWTSRAVAIWSLFFLGDWNELERRVLTGLREAGDRGNLYATQCVCGSFGIVAWLVRNQAEEARSNLDDITGRWRVRGFQLQNLYFMIADLFVLLFSGRGADAWSRLNGRWRVIAGSAVTLRLPMFRSHELHVRGCCAIAGAAAEPRQGGARRRLLGEAARASRRLDGIGLPHAHWLAELLRAGIDVQEGRIADSLRRLEGAREALDRLEMFGFSAAARRRIAQLRGEHPPDFLPGQGVVNPDGIARMLLPGFPEG